MCLLRIVGKGSKARCQLTATGLHLGVTVSACAWTRSVGGHAYLSHSLSSNDS